MPQDTEREWNQKRLIKITALKKAGSPKDGAKAIRIMNGVEDCLNGVSL